jgi:hypothetical protein
MATVPTVPPTHEVPLEQQSQEVEQAQKHESNGAPPELQSAEAQAAMKIQQKYAEERQKRIRGDGDAQYVVLAESEKFKHFADDIWRNERSDLQRVQDGEHVKFVILGGGFAGVQFAARLVEAGESPSDILIVDTAGGFGGTWYWNRCESPRVCRRES